MQTTGFGLAVASLLAVACGGGASGSKSTTPQGKQAGGIAAAGLPYKILRARGGGEVEESQFLSEVRAARAVCLGESHSNPHHHWVQLQLVDRGAAPGKPHALGMEMFQVPFQGVLDDYGARRIDEGEFLSRSGWKDRWGFDYQLYKPIIDLAVERDMALLALNAPKELTKKLARGGMESLTDAERARLPEMKLDDATHRAWFKAQMGAHPHGHGHGDSHGKDEELSPEERAKAEAKAKKMAERIYSAQVLWDESMAENAARWLDSNAEGRLFILAGNGHCHDSAIVGRLKRRGIGSVISVQPIIDDGEGNVAQLLAAPNADFLVVMRPPDG
jgi:uncharacterized iron-regulated protein